MKSTGGDGRSSFGEKQGAKEQLFQLYSLGSIQRFIPENDSRIIGGLSAPIPHLLGYTSAFVPSIITKCLLSICLSSRSRLLEARSLTSKILAIIYLYSEVESHELQNELCKMVITKSRGNVIRIGSLKIRN